MTADNDVELVRIFPRLTGAAGGIMDQTIKSTEQFQIGIEAEAGQTLFNNGGPFVISAVVQDLNDNSNVVVVQQTGNFGAAPWNNQRLDFVFPPIAAQGAAKQDHIYQAVVVLRAGVGNPIVEFAESPMFVITPP